MTIKKQTVTDKIEVTEAGCVQVRTATRILEDEKIISTAYHRRVIEPGQDYSQEDERVQAICAAVHTPDIVSSYQAIMSN